MNATQNTAFLTIHFVQLSELLKATFADLPLVFWPSVFAFTYKDTDFVLIIIILFLLRCFVRRAVHFPPPPNNM